MSFDIVESITSSPVKVTKPKSTKATQKPELLSTVRSTFTNKSVTADIYDSLEQLYKFLHDEFFCDTPLSGAALTIQRRAHSAGHFAPNKYNLRVNANGEHPHEINLNPDGFTGKTDKQVGQTMLHEMDHEWQHLYGTKKRAKYSYHDREWADKMESQGLMPSNTGAVGGKRTGVKMSDYIVPGGPFDKAMDELTATGWRLNIESAIVPGPIKKPPSKVKFSCSICDQAAWGKPGLEINCRVCRVEMTSAASLPGDAS